jgi:DNA-binding NarL/FixJ family response regulator
MAGSKIRILIADDHGIVREGIRMILSTQEDFEVVGRPARAGRRWSWRTA